MNSQSLYKYYSCNENNFEALEQRYFYLNTPLDYNDPYDSKINIYFQVPDILNPEVTEDKVINMGYDPNLFSKKMPATKERLDEFYQNHRICCFSKLNNNLLMWSHYAESHTGFCLGFKPIKIEDQEEEFIGIKIKDNQLKLSTNMEHCMVLKKVKYSDSLPEDFNGFSDNFLKIVNLIAHKHKGWSYEEEYRAIYMNNSFEDSNKSYKIYYDISALNSIYIGAKTSEKCIKKIINIVEARYKDNCNFRPKIYHCVLNKKEYKIIFNEI